MGLNYQKTKNIVYILAGLGLISIIGLFLAALVFYSQLRSEGYGTRIGVDQTAPSSEIGVLAPSYGSVDEKPGISEEQVIEEGGLTERKVVKNGSLSLLVKKAEDTAGEIKNIAGSLEGYVSSSRIYEASEGVKSGKITIKVPADRFDQAMKEIKSLAVKVEDEQESTRDVTEEFVDLEARVNNLKAEETQYLELMAKTDSVEEILKITARLSSVRSQIERIEGRLKYLSEEVEMSSIQVSLTSEAEIEVFGIRWRPLYTAKKSFKGMLSGLSNYVNSVISFVFALPVILLWLGSFTALAFVSVKVFTWSLRKLKNR